jgi:hypothetical protein
MMMAGAGIVAFIAIAAYFGGFTLGGKKKK